MINWLTEWLSSDLLTDLGLTDWLIDPLKQWLADSTVWILTGRLTDWMIYSRLLVLGVTHWNTHWLMLLLGGMTSKHTDWMSHHWLADCLRAYQLTHWLKHWLADSSVLNWNQSSIFVTCWLHDILIYVLNNCSTEWLRIELLNEWLVLAV